MYMCSKHKSYSKVTHRYLFVLMFGLVKPCGTSSKYKMYSQKKIL